jgi:hypothetical protein
MNEAIETADAAEAARAYQQMMDGRPVLPDRSPLEATYTARSLARARLEEAAATLERAQRVATIAHERVSQAEQAAAADQAAQARKLEASLVAGGKGAAPSTKRSDELAQSLQAARNAAAIAAKALTSLKTAHDERQFEVQKAEGAVMRAVAQFLSAEAETIAADVERHEAAAVAGRIKLAALSLQNRVAFSRAVDAALNPTTNMTAPPRRGDEMISQNGPHRPLLAAAEESWRKRIAQLIAGDEATASADAQAA